MGFKSFITGLVAKPVIALSDQNNQPYGDRWPETEAGAIDNSIEQGKKNKYLPYDMKAVYRTRQDISNWNADLAMAQAEYPINYPLQLLYDEILIDAMLTSQVENRKNQVFSSIFNLKKPDGSNDDDQTKALKSSPLYRFFINAIYDKKFRGNRVVELSMNANADGVLCLNGDLIPCTNIVQQTGLFYPDYFDTSQWVKYRELPEFGTWILEFDSKDLGMLNKAVPHVLFKRFAQSCWSELCEIYGIPPRVMHTNTQDPVMLSRATKMMKDMGAAAWFIIDDQEKFEWAKGADTNGDVYKNLMDACRDEMCLLISGAIIGQDTKNGARSKDQSAQEMLWLNVQSDMSMIEEDFNNIILPVLKLHGVITGEVSFAFEPSEDTTQLWTITLGLLQYYNIPPDFITKKFGVEITSERAQPIKGAGAGGGQGASLFAGDDSFFRKAPRRKSA